MSFEFDTLGLNQANLNLDGGFSQSGVSGLVGNGLAGAGFGVGGSGNISFDQVDVNRDGVIDRNEFNQIFGSSGRSGFTDTVTGGGTLTGGGTVIGQTSSGICNPPTYATDARGYFQDPNPQVVNRPNPNPGPTYTQNIRIRFHRPPPLPQSQPIIIEEVRPPPPPPPQPVRNTIPPTPAPQPPPLVLRERPPVPPPVLPGGRRTVQLPPFPPVPRSVITERHGPHPPRPRDIIMERWIPYGPQNRQPVIRRPAPCGPFPTPPRNVIINYESAKARVVRQFQRLGVTETDPQAYIQQFGASLLDSATFVQQARSAGVIEDISPPVVGASFGSSSSGFATGSGVSGGGFEAGPASSYTGFDGAALGGGFDGVSTSGTYSSSSGFGGAAVGGGFDGVSTSGTYSSSSGFGGSADLVGAAFQSADTNQNGTLSSTEFSNFVQQGQ